MKKNTTLIQFFDWYCSTAGNHWIHFAEEIPRLLQWGITAAWLPPAYKGTRGACSEGYDVYDIYDFGEFDQKGSVTTKYGTKQEYIDALQTARAAGLQVYVDIVLNHMGGAEETEKIVVRKVNPHNRTEFTSEPFEIEAYTKFQFPARQKKYSAFVWDHHCFTGIDHAVGTDEEAIYTICNEYGHDWEPLVDNEKGNFDYLILNDIETRNPAVREELKRWIKWYYDTVPFDGVRLDAVKHINPSFFNEWLDYARRNIDPSLFALGEYWLSDDLPVLLKYIEATGGRMSLFDAPLHHNLSVASIQKEQYDLRNILQDSLVSARPDLAVTFVDNHDTQPLQSLEEYVDPWFRLHAYAFILLREHGYPCIFYPDLYGSCYKGNNTKGEETEINIQPLAELPLLLQARTDAAYGSQQDYFDDPHCIGWTRSGDPKWPGSGLAVLLSNSPTHQLTKKMSIGKDFVHCYFYNALDPSEKCVKIDQEGHGLFSVNPGSVAVWKYLCAK